MKSTESTRVHERTRGHDAGRMVHPARRSTRSGPLILVSLASISLLLARRETTASEAWVLLTTFSWLAMSWLLWLGLATRKPLRFRLEAGFPLVLAGWLTAPLLWEGVGRLAGVGEAFEIVLLNCLQTTALACGVYSHQQRCLQAASLAAPLLLLFALVVGPTAWVLGTACLFGGALVWWMMALYWERVTHALPANQSEQWFPIRSVALGVLLLVTSVFVMPLAAQPGTTYALFGLMPSSGGERWSDPYARGGIGDGDALVAAQEDAMSFGAVDTDVFLDSEMPSLYDIFNDVLGEPPRPQTLERTVALEFQETKENEEEIARDQRGGREFSVVRRSPTRRPQSLDDRQANALMYVQGEVPLHLAMERYDTFDGRTWSHSHAAFPHPKIRVHQRRGKPWMQLANEVGASGRPPVSWVLKVVNLNAVRIPSPPQLAALHIDRIATTDFFRWTKDGVVEMVGRERIPQLTVIHLESSQRDCQPFRERDFTAGLPKPAADGNHSGSFPEPSKGLRQRHLTLPGERAHLARRFSAWTAGVPRGWRQVERVVARMRSDFHVDAHAVPDPAATDAVADFLQTGRGPSYLFASAAAMILRAGGYPTRLVTGFYASSENYDRRERQTGVYPQDVHVWVEVMVNDRTWIPIEPTPGYRPPRETLSWSEWFSGVCQGAARWLARQLVWLSALVLSIAATWVTRRSWGDVLLTLICRAGALGSWGSPRRQLLWTVRLLEWRGWLAGHPRPHSSTLTAWHGGFAEQQANELRKRLLSALRAAEQLLYGSPEQFAVSDPAALRASCAMIQRRAGVALIRRTFQAMRAAPHGGRPCHPDTPIPRATR